LSAQRGAPHSERRVVDAGHFIWEDAADEYAALVNAWWADGFKTCTATPQLRQEVL
jgi:pimeloyl-ACP methyl ester carboxylesterase